MTDAPVHELTPLGDLDDRRQRIDAAARAFAAALGRPAPAPIGSLLTRGLEREPILAIYARALATVLTPPSPQGMRTKPDHMPALESVLAGLIDHEQTWWRKTTAEPHWGLPALSDRQLRAVVVTLASMGSTPQTMAVERLRRLPDLTGLPDADLYNLARWAAHLYPVSSPTTSDVETISVALRPELLQDWLVVDALTRHPAWADAAFADLDDVRSEHALGLLVRAAAQFPAGLPLLRRFLAGSPPRMDLLATVVMGTATSDGKLDQITADAIARNPLTLEQYHELDKLIPPWALRRSRAVIAEAVVAVYRRRREEASLAEWLRNLGIRYSEVGRREDALAPAEEAVQIRRRLAQANPAAYEPDLARSLNNLGIRYSGVGRREDALAPAEEAVQIYRRLAQANPAAYEPALARALNNLGTSYSEVGRREDALAPAEEAAQIYRRLAQANPAAYEPDLARSLNNLGTSYSGVGRREDALAPAEEAAQIYRRLAQANPAAYEPDLASALNNLGTRYSEVGRREDALAPAEEAAQIHRRLAQANPAAYEPDLARSLNNLGNRYSGVGRREDALAPAEEAAQIYRRLAQANPAAYEPALARSLNNLGSRYSGVGRREDALAPAEEAVQIHRRLAQANPAAYEPDLAMSLNNLGIRYSGVGRREDALAPAEEAVQIYRRLAQANPAAYEPDLAGALTQPRPPRA